MPLPLQEQLQDVPHASEGDDESLLHEWDHYPLQTQSPSDPAPLNSPLVDISGFHAVMKRAAAGFQLPIDSREEDCFLYGFKKQPLTQVHSIPIIGFIWQEGLKLMQTPNSVPAVLPRLDKYKAPASSPVCLMAQPKPDSIITRAAQRQSRNQSAPLTVPPDREGRRLDAIGRKFSTMAATTVRAANSLAILGRYDRQMWSDIAPLIPEPSKAEALLILQEGERISSEIDCAVDISPTGFRQLAGAAVLGQQGWLKATSFRQEVQMKILNMPYDGESLFGQHVDEALQMIKDTDTARALGTLQETALSGCERPLLHFLSRQLQSILPIPVLRNSFASPPKVKDRIRHQCTGNTEVNPRIEEDIPLKSKDFFQPPPSNSPMGWRTNLSFLFQLVQNYQQISGS